MLQTADEQKHEKLEACVCTLSFLSAAYLWFFDQLQQVFNVLSQQILALPHLIQSSERIQIKGFSSDAHRSTIVIVSGHREDVLDSVCVQGSVQIVKTLHSLGRFQVVRDHVLGEDPLHQ